MEILIRKELRTCTKTRIWHKSEDKNYEEKRKWNLLWKVWVNMLAETVLNVHWMNFFQIDGIKF